jgi:uncharacterized protein (TIGR02996 family)
MSVRLYRHSRLPQASVCQMTDHAPFLHAIIARPEDDGPRLLFAGFLDENGEPDRAEFIRCQVELSRIKCDKCNNGIQTAHDGFRSDGGEVIDEWPCTCGQAQLRRREAELKTIHNLVRWTPQIAAFADVDRVEFQRGFVHSVTCSWSDWQRHASTIRAATPIRNVRLTTEPDTHLFVSIGGRVWTCATWPGIEFELPPYRYTDGYGPRLTHHHHLCQCEECLILHGTGEYVPRGIINA